MDTIDISFIGSGIATTVTLIEVFNTLLNNVPPQPKITIGVIEKYTEFWKGIPYGDRSSVNALTITSVNDFIYEHERPLFFNWLKASREDWITYYREHGGTTAARWLENNLPLIENNAWETVYIPRFIFGNYLQQKLTGLLNAAEEQQLATIKLIRAEAIDVKVMDNSLYKIILEHPDSVQSAVLTRKLVIATGSAPVKKMCAISDNTSVYINDIYDPSVKNNITTIQTALIKTSKAENRNILIIGSNASSIEFLYLFEGIPGIRKLVNKIIIISPSGILPYHISTETLDNHPIPNLDKLKDQNNYTIQTLAEAAAEDIKLAVQHGANMDYVATIISNTLKLMEVLGEDAHKAFYATHGVRLRDMFRRSGPEYKSGAQSLLDEGQVTLLKGKFSNTSITEQGAELSYIDMATGRQQTYPLCFNTIINCSGSDDLDRSDSRLLYNLVNNKICQMNLSKKGLEVNEKFEAAPNLYVMGPLLGGNVNKLIHFWQLENASRLTGLAPYLSRELLNNK